MTKNIVIPTIAAIALVVVIGTMAYLELSRAPTQEQQEQGGQGMGEERPVTATLPEPTISEIDTSDWKTYRNEDYGFEIRYPPELTVLERSFSTDFVGGIQFFFPKAKFIIDRYEFSGRKFWRGKVPDPCDPPSLREFPNQTLKEIGGVTFTKVSNKNTSNPIYYIGKGGAECYRLQLYLHEAIRSGQEELLKQAVSQFEQIVSTFKHF